MTFTVPMVRADWLTVETVVILCTSTATGQYHHANVSLKHHRTDTQIHTHTHIFFDTAGFMWVTGTERSMTGYVMLTDKRILARTHMHTHTHTHTHTRAHKHTHIVQQGQRTEDSCRTTEH